MIAAAGHLLYRYPPSSAKSEAARVLRGVDRVPVDKSTLRSVVYDIVYAFQLLEARRLSIRPDRHLLQYAEFRQDFIAALAMWVPGKDPLTDDIMRAIHANTEGRKEEVGTLLRKMLQSAENRERTAQSSNGKSPRRLKTLDHYILDALRENPKLSEKELWRQIERDSEDLTDKRIGEVEHDGVWVIDPMPNGKSSSQFYARSSLRSRLSRLRIKFNSSH